MGSAVRVRPPFTFGQYWSRHGYLSVFIQHAGSDTTVWKGSENKEIFMDRMRGAANGKNLIDRVADVKFVIDQLERLNKTDATLKEKMDLNHIAVAGHSFGAGTSLAIAGGYCARRAPLWETNA